jgi:hypothetical protein
MNNSIEITLNNLEDKELFEMVTKAKKELNRRYNALEREESTETEIRKRRLGYLKDILMKLDRDQESS